MKVYCTRHDVLLTESALSPIRHSSYTKINITKHLFVDVMSEEGIRTFQSYGCLKDSGFVKWVVGYKLWVQGWTEECFQQLRHLSISQASGRWRCDISQASGRWCFEWRCYSLLCLHLMEKDWAWSSPAQDTRSGPWKCVNTHHSVSHKARPWCRLKGDFRLWCLCERKLMQSYTSFSIKLRALNTSVTENINYIYIHKY